MHGCKFLFPPFCAKQMHLNLIQYQSILHLWNISRIYRFCRCSKSNGRTCMSRFFAFRFPYCIFRRWNGIIYLSQSHFWVFLKSVYGQTLGILQHYQVSPSFSQNLEYFQSPRKKFLCIYPFTQLFHTFRLALLQMLQ